MCVCVLQLFELITSKQEIIVKCCTSVEKVITSSELKETPEKEYFGMSLYVVFLKNTVSLLLVTHILGCWGIWSVFCQGIQGRGQCHQYWSYSYWGTQFDHSRLLPYLNTYRKAWPSETLCMTDNLNFNSCCSSQFPFQFNILPEK